MRGGLLRSGLLCYNYLGTTNGCCRDLWGVLAVFEIVPNWLVDVFSDCFMTFCSSSQPAVKGQESLLSIKVCAKG